MHVKVMMLSNLFIPFPLKKSSSPKEVSLMPNSQANMKVIIMFKISMFTWFYRSIG